GGRDVGSRGAAGSVYIKDTNESHGTLIFDAGPMGDARTPLGLPGQAAVTIPDAVVIRGGNTHVAPEHSGMTFDFQAGLTVTGSASFQADGALKSEGPVTVSGGGTLQSTGGLDSTQTVTIDGGTIKGMQVMASVSAIGNGTIDLGGGALTF